MITKRIYMYMFTGMWVLYNCVMSDIPMGIDCREDFGPLGPTRDNYRLPTKKMLVSIYAQKCFVLLVPGCWLEPVTLLHVITWLRDLPALKWESRQAAAARVFINESVFY